ncbi:CDP-alcohol phosphatidyltransferase family protein [Trichomonas vaginalis G3]|uniref:CDP-alcohol phosphatidyltransferase family protein n=1 Tax=Trichomonas vaginalis (strain ATCC PRA-98 / G3) TaxID=412133 RepID=A2F799_TRIV3|nr:CDP-alcohol phosphatidyltransferase class-I family [Trichomonas vaginalis G3]EAX99214.1 CDP-alcohol phosphatidyltransferase family protein [Trichomonas vaginalis G3]KAI5538734.1 CDP-alcohol phosphatidyltransferase class-I family [Trichomonas vaginalis G3]|eukprot:XP_001312144.1 CDP-alcohol phosphatidyltransferase family protein [Trichomonas vaginalis G3]
MQIFTEDELQAAKNHKYSGTDDSLLVRFCLKYIWNWMVEKFPMWLAPNVITLTGFLFEVVSFLISFIASNCMSKSLPGWVCILDGVFLLIYQTLDNLDGKQARRTGSSSALGQFFDHGCDAITGCLELMKVSMVLDFGPSVKTLIFVSCMGIGFLLTTWVEFCTHKFYLGYLNGPDEGLFILGVVQILVGIKPDLKSKFDSKFINYGFLICFALTICLVIFDVLVETFQNPAIFCRGIASVIPCWITFSIFLGHAIRYNFENLSPFFIMLCGLVLQFGGQMIIIAIITARPAKRLYSKVVILEWIVLLIPFIPGFKSDNLFWQICFYAHLLVMLVTDINVVYSLSTGIGIPIFHIIPKPPPEQNDQEAEDVLNLVINIEDDADVDKLAAPVSDDIQIEVPDEENPTV